MIGSVITNQLGPRPLVHFAQVEKKSNGDLLLALWLEIYLAVTNTFLATCTSTSEYTLNSHHWCLIDHVLISA